MSYAHAFESRQRLQWPQCSQCSHGFERRNIGHAKPIENTAQNAHDDNDEIQPVPSVGEVDRYSVGEPFQDQFSSENNREDLVQHGQDRVEDRLLSRVDIFQCLDDRHQSSTTRDSRALTNVVLLVRILAMMSHSK